MAKELTHTVTIPADVAGETTYYGHVFVNGMAHGVPAGFALDEFRDWGFEVVPEFAMPVPVEPSEADVETMLDAAREAHKAEAAPSVPAEEFSSIEDVQVTPEEIAEATAEFLGQPVYETPAPVVEEIAGGDMAVPSLEVPIED